MCECNPLRTPDRQLRNTPIPVPRPGAVAKLVVASILLFSCASAPDPLEPPPGPTATAPASAVHALTFSADGTRLYYASGVDRCRLSRMSIETRDVETVRDLSFCPERLTAFVDGSILAASATSSEWISSDATSVLDGRTILAALDSSHLLEQTSEGLVWLDGETSVVLDVPSLRSPRIAAGGTLLGVISGADGERIVRFDGASPSSITPTFGAIDSWDIAPRGEEVVFSAQVGRGFDVGIVSVSGGEISWISPEPADERNVTWAPRGSKVTYTFESLDATLVRSVHVPTSYQVIFDLPLSAVRQVGWEPRAERFAIVVESPASGPRIDWIGYQGENRETLVDATERVESPVEALLWEGGSGILLGPETVRYGEMRTTVVMVEANDPFKFRPETVRLRRAGLPLLITLPDRLGALSSAMAGLPWFSSSRLYIADVSGAAGNAAGTTEAGEWLAREGRPAPPGAVVIPGDDAQFRAAAVHRILEREGPKR